jgi:hypothetical protein
MKGIKDFSTEELKKELEKRILSKKRPVPIINAAEGSGLDILISYCENYIDALINDDDDIKDYEHYIYELAMEMIYGKAIWRWLANFEK